MGYSRISVWILVSLAPIIFRLCTSSTSSSVVVVPLVHLNPSGHQVPSKLPWHQYGSTSYFPGFSSSLLYCLQCSVTTIGSGGAEGGGGGGATEYVQLGMRRLAGACCVYLLMERMRCPSLTRTTLSSPVNEFRSRENRVSRVVSLNVVS